MRLNKFFIAAAATGALTCMLATPTLAAGYPHGLGALGPRHTFVTQYRKAQPAKTPNLASVPRRHSLRRWAMPVGNQGQINSCASWATSYGAMGILENRLHIRHRMGGAPMYVYSQVGISGDKGSYTTDNLNLESTQGIDDQSDYWQGNFNYWTRPTTHEHRNAHHWRITSWKQIGAYKGPIERAIAGGHPVVIQFPVTSSFEYNTNGIYPSYNGHDDSYSLGNHDVVAVGYKSTGLVLENSWGLSWGCLGYVTMRWSWVNRYVEDAWLVHGMHH